MKTRSRLHNTALFLLAGVIGLAAWVGLTPSCSDTAGRKVEFVVGVRGALSGNGEVAPFTNAKGWRVTLEEAYMVLGPIYFYANEALSARRNGAQRKPGLTLRTAVACPAHAQYDKGTVLGEVLEQYVVDLLAGETLSFGSRVGVAGTVKLFELHLHPPETVPLGTSPHSPETLNGHTIWVSGTAVRDTQTIHFVGGLTVPDEGTLRVVDQIPAEVDLNAVSAAGGMVVVEVLLDSWFANVDFGSLTQTDDRDRHVIDGDSQAHVAWLQGVRSRYAYTLKGI